MRKPGYTPSTMKPMRSLIVLLVLSMGQVGALPTDSDGIAVRLSLDKQRYTVGEQIQVRVEVQNQGSEALIIPNLTTAADVRAGYVQFDLTDAKGRRQTPQLRVSELLGSVQLEPDWRLLLGQWLVLYPQTSFTSQLSLDGATFPFLTKPGRYKLSATYSSAGLSYGVNYRRLGLKEKDVASLRFPSWSGKVRSNSVWISIVPAHLQRK